MQVIEGLDTLVNLDSLFLGKNKIEKLQVCKPIKQQTHGYFHFHTQGLDKLTKLRVLSVQVSC